jgi:uncharacterized protein (DUF433 family)
MSEPCIVDRGDGPKIQGTRITVYTVLEYLRAGRSRDWIAALLALSSRQVQAAMDYIRDNEARVSAEYERILARIREGNPPHVESQLRANREKLKARLARQPSASR